MDSITITTAINYTNGPPHIGHAYEAITTDIIARYHRHKGRKVFFLTGTDEHGQKIQKTANLAGISPKELCDKNVELFKKLNNRLNISNDYFIRTTDSLHAKTVERMFDVIFKKGDIYLGEYEGWYMTREERYITELEAKSTNYKDSLTGKEYQKVKEPSYFFKMEKYRSALINHIKNTGFITDTARRNEILNRLYSPLLDLSISRCSFNWGIPIKINPKHVLYVWFDALINYLSGINYFKDNKLWPATHIIGQDILWFHAVIWPCILLSAGIELPKTIIVHGFINDSQNRKMSKSVGNVIDPDYLLSKYSSDQIRYYFIRGGVFGSDFKFSEEILIDKNNTELANLYGNLVRRIFKLVEKYYDNNIPEIDSKDINIDSEINEVYIDGLMFSGQLSQALEIIVSELHNINKWLYTKEPWKIDDEYKKKVIIRNSLYKIQNITHYLYPYIPTITTKVLSQIGETHIYPDNEILFKKLTV